MENKTFCLVLGSIIILYMIWSIYYHFKNDKDTEEIIIETPQEKLKKSIEEDKMIDSLLVINEIYKKDIKDLHDQIQTLEIQIVELQHRIDEP